MEHKEGEGIQSEQREEEKNLKNEELLRNLWDTFKRTNIWILGMPEGEEKEQEIESTSQRIMKENFRNLVKEIDMKVQEAPSQFMMGIQRGPLQDTS